MPHPRQTLTATVAAAGIVQLPTAAIVVAVPTIHRELGTSIAELIVEPVLTGGPRPAPRVVEGRRSRVSAGDHPQGRPHALRRGTGPPPPRVPGRACAR